VVHIKQYKPHMAQLRARLAIFIRERRGASPQRAFARKTGLAQSTIMRIENEDQNVTLETLEQLCRVFHVDIDELFPSLPARHYPALSAKGAYQPAMVHEQRAKTSAARNVSSSRRRVRTDDSGDGA